MMTAEEKRMYQVMKAYKMVSVPDIYLQNE